ncbi:MAG: hypothetical protein WC975_01840 [Phycisphaerae bacterium]
MIRRILLAVISLVIILACYMLYTTLFAPPVVDEQVQPEEHIKIPARARTTVPVKPMNLSSPEDVMMGGAGEKPKFERYSRNRLLYQFQSDHWKPVGSGTGRFSLDKPELRLFLRGGQLLHVSAAEGEIETEQSKTAKMDPRRGELRGKVHIFIDRGTDPNRSAPELRPADVLHIWLDKVKFDLVQNIIESDSPIKVESDEVELVGQALTITWDALTNQIEEITIKRGEKLVLRQGFDMISPDMPFSQGKKKEGKGNNFFGVGGTAASRDLGSRMLLSRGTVAKSDIIFPRKKQQEPTTASTAPSVTKHKKSTTQSTQPRISKSYDLVFTSDVKIFQYDGRQLTGKMNCDSLHVLFDLPHGSEDNGLTTRPAKKNRETVKDDNKRLEIFWEGPLQMLPANLPYSAVRRFHIVALGQPIQIDQAQQGTVRCKKMTYFQESKQLWLDGTTDEPVNVSQGADRTIVAAHLLYDRKLGIVSGKGPGFMQQQQSSSTKPASEPQGDMLSLGDLQSGRQKMMVLWKEGFKLNFGEFEKVDATTGQKSVKQYIKRAEFKGSARMQRPGEIMAGDEVVLNFLTPGTNDTSNEKISTFHAERNVTLQSDSQQINCDWLDVEFGDGTFGWIPKLAKAKGHVMAKENRRVIEADVLVAIMEDKKVLPTTMAKRHDREGVNISKSKTRIVLREVDASGNVTIRDPDQPMSVDSQKMHAILDPDGAIRWCYLEGTDRNWAKAVLKDYALSGEKVTMDMMTEQIDVPGPGELQFVNRQDIEGSKTSKPVPIAISWADSMKMTGGTKNQGTFLGDTKVRSNQTTLYCARMLVDFANTDLPENPSAKPAGNTSTDRFWIFSRLLGKSTGEIKPSVQLPIARKRPTYIQAFADTGKQIIIQYLVKEAAKPLSRTTLWGNELTLDLAANRMNIPGPGKFFIEDYRLPGHGSPKPDKKASGGANVPELKDPFGGDIQSAGPSQTAFTWQTGLTYLLDTRTAIFDGSVRMLHVAGAKTANRQSTLTCENLKAEFLRGGFGFTDQASGASELKSVVATGAVNLQDKPRSVIAQRLMYNRADNMIAVYGSEKEPAYLYEENDQTGQYSMWTGPWIMWDRSTNEIRCPNAKVITTLK